LKRDKDFLPE